MKVTYPQITALLQKFSPKELLSLIPELFPAVGWEKVNSYIMKNRLSRQSKFIALTTSTLYEETKPSNKELQDVHWFLQFYDRIHHNNHEWYGIRLTDKVEEVSDSSRIEKNIIRAYRTDARDADIMLKVDDDLIYMMTIEKKTSRNGVKYKKPFFFIYNQNLCEPYGLYSPKFSESEDLVIYCCKGMGFNSYEEISLFGNDIFSLFGMIERNVDSSRALDVKRFHPVTVVEEDCVVDFRLRNERRKYAEKVLPGLTKLQQFTVEANNEWRGAPYLPLLDGYNVDSALIFKSSTSNVSIENIFKEMVIRGMISLPLPSYIANLPYVPTNTVQLPEEVSHS